MLEDSVMREVERLEKTRMERVCYSAVESDYKEPVTYNQMMTRPVEERKKWLKGVRKELVDFENRGV